MKCRISISLFVAPMLAASHCAFAQFAPVRPVRIIVPFSPGGGTDIIARLLAAKLGDEWGRTVIVDNRAGAATVPGSEMVAKSPPDGHTMLLTANPHTSNPVLIAKLPYDTLQDFTAITLIATAPSILVVHSSMPVRSVEELVKLAKSRPGQLAYASSGNGGPQHLAAELFRSMARIDILHVPFKGTGTAMTAIISGEVQLSFTSLLGVLPHLKLGRLRALGITSARRSASNPEFPTIAESGLPGYELLSYYGLFAAGRTPVEMANQINADVVKALKSPEIFTRLERDGLDFVGSDPASFHTFVRNEIEKVARLAKVTGLKAE